jgi:hypothetical protein
MQRKQRAINSVWTGGASLEERLATYAGAGFAHVEFALGQVKELRRKIIRPRTAAAV